MRSVVYWSYLVGWFCAYGLGVRAVGLGKVKPKGKVTPDDGTADHPQPSRISRTNFTKAELPEWQGTKGRKMESDSQRMGTLDKLDRLQQEAAGHPLGTNAANVASGERRGSGESGKNVQQSRPLSYPN